MTQTIIFIKLMQVGSKSTSMGPFSCLVLKKRTVQLLKAGQAQTINIFIKKLLVIYCDVVFQHLRK